MCQLQNGMLYIQNRRQKKWRSILMVFLSLWLLVYNKNRLALTSSIKINIYIDVQFRKSFLYTCGLHGWLLSALWLYMGNSLLTIVCHLSDICHMPTICIIHVPLLLIHWKRKHFWSLCWFQYIFLKDLNS